ncbi:MAG TPA: hypothetical protein VJ483_01315 [Holophagaceae bacterium]|nr:hypothetical protein [Holophagaceae bacterium]
MSHSAFCRWSLPLFVAAGLGAQTTKPAAAPAFAWPVPQGWGHETIPFPLDFAPELKHKGIEELRFMPGFFDPASPNWWSYAFVWVLDDAELPSMKQLEPEVTLYFKGLCTAVGGKKGFRMDPAQFQCRLKEDPGLKGYRGQVGIYDAFKTGEALTLQLRIKSWKGAGRRFVAVAASPKLPPAAPWAELDECLSQALETSSKP